MKGAGVGAEGSGKREGEGESDATTTGRKIQDNNKDMANIVESKANDNEKRQQKVRRQKESQTGCCFRSISQRSAIRSAPQCRNAVNFIKMRNACVTVCCALVLATGCFHCLLLAPAPAPVLLLLPAPKTFLLCRQLRHGRRLRLPSGCRPFSCPFRGRVKRLRSSRV